MRPRLLGFGLFVLFLLFALVLMWPATALAPWIGDASNRHWRLASAEGRLWNGKGVLLARTGDSATWHSAQNIRWRLRWSDLWRGRFGVEAGVDQGGALVMVGLDGFYIEQLDATLTTALLGVLLPGALGRYGWAGSLHGRGKDFSCAWQSRTCQGEIELIWSNAGVAEILGGELGDYRIRLVGEGPTLRLDLSTLSGRLQIAGNGEIIANAVRFNGEAGATGPDAASLNNLLRTIGRPGATPGRFTIDYRGAGF